MDCERTECAGLFLESKAACVYKCISLQCYDEVYAHDELEEGEVDTERSRQFGFCFRKYFRQEQEARLEKQRKESDERKARVAAANEAERKRAAEARLAVDQKLA
mmetsp:Transcript_30967/g.48537  ORF Transcript_30967/g.48537 Transcript_30967/m.48537 type:complete len:105 (+) Transcript_30967:59-373(+)